MYIPKIFISSTFIEFKQIRTGLRKFFYLIGAKPILYEFDLTPSTKKNTYRSDILDSDFVIIIVGKNYGTKTVDIKLSGIHEEYRIAKSNGIPFHIYIEKTLSNTSDNPLFNEINNDQNSYYYFNNDKELMKQIKSKTVELIKTAFIKKISAKDFDTEAISKVVLEHDKCKFAVFQEYIKEMIKLNSNYNLDYVKTTLFFDFAVLLTEFEYFEFISCEFSSIYCDLIKILNEFSIHYSNFSTPGDTVQKLYIRKHNEMIITRTIFIENLTYNIEYFNFKVNEFLDKYNQFCIEFHI